MKQYAKEIIQKIEEYDTIIIHRHQHPDPDAYGSQGGLATAIMQSFPAKKVYQVGKNIPPTAPEVAHTEV